MKALIFVPVWKRIEMALVTYKGIHRIQDVLKKEGIDSTVLVVSSEDYHTELAKKEGFEVVECENFPISDKHNCGMGYALTLNWDYLFQMGSNNLVTSKYVKEWAKVAKSNAYEIFGTCNLVNILEDRKHLTMFNVKGDKGPAGVARGISRKAIERVISKHKLLWKPGLNKGLDYSSHERIGFGDFKKLETIPSILDIRTSEDINSMDRRRYPLKPKKEGLLKHFPELTDVL